jgi:hypothetical protein
MKLLFSEWLNESAEYTDRDLQGKYVPEELIQRMLDIEEKAYPETMRILNHAIKDYDIDISKVTPREFHDYLQCGGNVKFILGEDWLILACDEGDHVEVHDLASANKQLTMLQVTKLLNFLKSFGKKKLHASARETTSYPLLLSLAKHGRLRIIRDKPRLWDEGDDGLDENGKPIVMHDVVFQFV